MLQATPTTTAAAAAAEQQQKYVANVFLLVVGQ